MESGEREWIESPDGWGPKDEEHEDSEGDGGLIDYIQQQ